MIDLCYLRHILTDVKRIEETLKRETSLTLNEALCVCQIDKGNIEPSSLSKELSLSLSRTSRVIDSLVKKDLVERIHDDKDRRNIRVTLTEEGEKTGKKLHTISLDIPDYLIKTVTEIEDIISTGENT
ncbi:MAG: MarR family transcriptional regulator [Sphaerochaetaceae bacterium]|nr:MarR family transcriptional regulator [Sphaerochaetaceae bacterium]